MCPKDQLTIVHSFRKKFDYLSDESFVKTKKSTFKMSLVNNDINFDVDLHGIHFNNGRFNLQTGELEERDPSTYAITKVIPWDYKPSTDKAKKAVINIIRPMFQEPEAMEYMMHYLGMSLSGTSVKQQSFMVHFGPGSAGKSTLLELIQLSLTKTYFLDLASDALKEKNQKRDKILNSFSDSIRYYWIDEIDESTLDTNLLKTIVNGRATTTKLFKDGQFEIRINGVFNFTTNHMLTYRSDTGMDRRICGYEYKNKFTDNEEEINNKTVFQKDKDLKFKFNTALRLALFDILAYECKLWYEGKKLEQPQCFKDAKDTIQGANDYWQDFIDKYLVEDADGRLSKKELTEIARQDDISKKFVTSSQVMNALKDKGLKYFPSLRKNGDRGIFVGYRLKESKDYGFLLDGGDDDSALEEVAALKKENAELKKQIAELKNQLQAQEKPKKSKKEKKTKKETKQEEEGFVEADIEEVILLDFE